MLNKKNEHAKRPSSREPHFAGQEPSPSLRRLRFAVRSDAGIFIAQRAQSRYNPSSMPAPCSWGEARQSV